MKKYDIIFISILLSASVIGYILISCFYGNKGAFIQVVEDGEVTACYSLLEDNKYVIGTDSEYNVLIINNGKAMVTDATCPDKICVHEKSISKNGESIICLPHKLVIRVISSEESDTDAVAY
ncbi:MAG: NusG domain II-containing protein [Eubacterium sp.]